MTTQELQSEAALESWKAIAAHLKRDDGNLAVVDVETETRTDLTASNWEEPPHAFVEYPVWSPDGTRIAYGWWTVNGRWELRVLSGSPILFEHDALAERAAC